jgi:hypothetical protein
MRNTVSRRRKGMSALQAVLLLGAGFLVTWGLMELWSDSKETAAANVNLTVRGEQGKSGSGSESPFDTSPERAPETRRTSPPATPNPRPSPARNPTPTRTPTTTTTAARPATPPPKTAQERLAQIRPTVDEAYNASGDIYGTTLKPGDVTPNGFKVEEILDDRVSGLRIAVLSKPTADGGKKYIMSTAGSEPVEDAKDFVLDPLTGLLGPKINMARKVIFGEGDIVTDGIQQLGGVPPQYKKGLEFAEKMQEKYKIEYGTGHSLGGGIQTYISGKTGMKAVLFNAAPLGFGALDDIGRNGVKNPEKNITNINVRGELVSGVGQKVNDKIYGMIPGGNLLQQALPYQGRAQQLGETFSTPRTGNWNDLIGDHMMDKIKPDRIDEYEPSQPLDPYRAPHK